MPAKDVKSYICDNDILLFSKNQHRLFYLNATAAFIWCCIEDNTKLQEIIQLLMSTFNITSEQAEKDLNQILIDWEHKGLLCSSTSNIANEPEEYGESLSEKFDLKVSHAHYSIRYYQLIDATFEIRIYDEDLDFLIYPLLKHLEINSALATTAEKIIVLDVVRHEKYYVLLADNLSLEYCEDIKSVTPMMHANILMLAYEATDRLFAIHAGAISKGDDCILLPAISGSGKSTLTAALLTEGYGYCTDDLAVLSRQELKIKPAAICLGIKQGSWPILLPYFPIINDLTTFVRVDEKVVRYMPPPAESLTPNRHKSYSVKYIIFPKYGINTKISLEPLGTAESLCRLTEAGYDVGGQLKVNHVDDLVSWISDIPCFTLEYNNLPDAISEIKKIF